LQSFGYFFKKYQREKSILPFLIPALPALLCCPRVAEALAEAQAMRKRCKQVCSAFDQAKVESGKLEARSTMLDSNHP
jgi:hypothetical protein